MARSLATKRAIHLRLVHDGVQPGEPMEEPLRFGLQDSKGAIHPGVWQPGDLLVFDFALEIGEGDEAAQPVFRGAFAHGPSTGRFLYLSWKREGSHEHPWAWRIKIPLSGINWVEIRAVEKPGRCLAANVIERRPHSSEAIEWRVENLH